MNCKTILVGLACSLLGFGISYLLTPPAGLAQGRNAPAIAEQLPSWEYKVVCLSADPPDPEPKLTKLMNQLAGEGWEMDRLVSSVKWGVAGQGTFEVTSNYFAFKRVKK